MPSLCLGCFGAVTGAMPSSSVFISSNLELITSKVLVFVSLLEKNLSLKRGSRNVAIVSKVFVSILP